METIENNNRKERKNKKDGTGCPGKNQKAISFKENIPSRIPSFLTVNIYAPYKNNI